MILFLYISMFSQDTNTNTISEWNSKVGILEIQALAPNKESNH